MTQEGGEVLHRELSDKEEQLYFQTVKDVQAELKEIKQQLLLIQNEGDLKKFGKLMKFKVEMPAKYGGQLNFDKEYLILSIQTAYLKSERAKHASIFNKTESSFRDQLETLNNKDKKMQYEKNY